MTKSTEMKKLALKFALLTTALILGVVVLSLNKTSIHQSAYASSSGSPGGRTNSPGDGGTCNQCHTGQVNPPSPPTAAATITSNIPPTGYIPGQTYTINAGFTGVNSSKIGFEATAEDDLTNNKVGTMIITDATRTKLVNGNAAVTHNGSAGTAAVSNSNAWSFDWTAPSSGTGSVTFYGAFNATNSNFSTSGDAVFTSTLNVNEAISTAIDENTDHSFSLYPNPVIDVLNISSSTNELKTINILRADGKLVSSQSRREQLISIDLGKMSSGIYFVEIMSGQDRSIDKIIKQ